MAEFVKIIAFLDGSQTEEIRGLDELVVATSFISDTRNTDTAQPVLTVNNFTFIGSAAMSIISYQEGGVNRSTVGLLEGMPLRLIGTDGVTTSQIFNGYLDFRSYLKISAVEVSCDILPTDSMNSFSSISSKTFFNILQIKGVYKQSDYISTKYITEKLNKDAEAGTLSLAAFTLSVAAFQQGKELGKDIANIFAHTAGGVSGPIAGPAYAIAIALIDAIVFAKIVIKTVKLGIEFAEIYLPPVFRHNTITQFNLLEKAVNHLGYSFETNITKMNNIVHFPGKIPQQNAISLGFPPPMTFGLPKLGQPGQTLGEFIGIMLKMYRAQLAIIGNVVHLRSENDPFWEKNSAYILPDFGDDEVTAVNLKSEKRVFNIRDFKASTVISLSEDSTDEYTRVNWRGTNIQVIREPIDINDENLLLHDGLDEVSIPFSLGTRKDTLDNVEQAVANVLTLIDDLVNLFGGNSNLAGFVTSRIGALRISEKTFSNPKFIYLEKVNGVHEIPLMHRKLLSAKVLYEEFHAEKSFVNTKPVLSETSSTDLAVTYEDIAKPDFGNQKALFNDFPVGFGYQDSLKIQNNSYFATHQGDRGKIEKSEWTVRQVKAVQSYWIKEIWIRNLKETFVEPV